MGVVVPEAGFAPNKLPPAAGGAAFGVVVFAAAPNKDPPAAAGGAAVVGVVVPGAPKREVELPGKEGVVLPRAPKVGGPTADRLDDLSDTGGEGPVGADADALSIVYMR